MASGRFQNVEDLLLQSLEAAPEDSPKPVRQNFLQFIQEPPLWGFRLTVKRQKDPPRSVDL